MESKLEDTPDPCYREFLLSSSIIVIARSDKRRSNLWVVGVATGQLGFEDLPRYERVD